MRHMKFTACICMIAMTIGMGGGAVGAAETPSVSVHYNSTEKSAEVTITNVSGGIFSAQLELSLNPSDGYSVTPGDGDYYCEIRQDSGSLTVFLDSVSPLAKNGTIEVATITSNSKFTVGSKADLLLADGDLQGTEYNGISVNQQKDSSGGSDDDNNNQGGSGSSSSHSSSSSSNVRRPSVSSGSQGSVKISSDGKTVTVTPKEGYRVKDLIINGTSMGPLTEYKFDKIGKDAKVEVIYEEIPKETPTAPPVQQQASSASSEFSDIPSGFWAQDSINFVVSTGLFYGTDEKSFSPNMNMTRSMFVTVLYRFENSLGSQWHVENQAPASFADVKEGMWYSDAAAWAGGIGLASGTGNGNFSPDSPITREQIAVMIVNFAQKCGIELPQIEQPSTFADEGQISSWAKTAVSKAQAAGILFGRDGNKMDPQATATRAEVAAMLERFVKNTGK